MRKDVKWAQDTWDRKEEKNMGVGGHKRKAGLAGG